MKDTQIKQIMLTKKLEQSSKIDIKSVNIEDVEDISNVKIDSRKSSVERILNFLDTCKNPYLFKVNGIIVQTVFSDDSNMNASECVLRALKNDITK